MTSIRNHAGTAARALPPDIESAEDASAPTTSAPPEAGQWTRGNENHAPEAPRANAPRPPRPASSAGNGTGRDEQFAQARAQAPKKSFFWRTVGAGGGALGGGSAGFGIAVALAVPTEGMSLLIPVAATAVGASLGGLAGYLPCRQCDHVNNIASSVKQFTETEIDGAPFDARLVRTLRSAIAQDLLSAGVTAFTRQACKAKQDKLTALLDNYLCTSLQALHPPLNDAERQVLVQLMGDPAIERAANHRVHAGALLPKLREYAEIRLRLQELLARPNPAWSISTSPYHQRTAALELLFGNLPPGAEAKDIAERVAYALVFGTLDVGKTVLAGATMGAMGAATEVISQQSGHGVSGSSQRFFDKVTEVFCDMKVSETQRLKIVHAHLMHMGASDLALLPTEIQKAVQMTDEKINEALRSGSCEIARTLLRRREGPLMSFPIDVRQLAAVSIVERPASIRQIDADVKKLLSEYPHMDELPRVIKEIRDNSRLKRPARRVQLFLVGARGVGKTRFVHRLAETLNLPLNELSLRSEDDFSQIMGSAGFKRAQMQSPDVEDLELLSPVPHALMVAGCKNPLLFFDESGETLDGQDQSRSWKVSPQAQLKTMLSDQNQDLRVEALGPNVKVDFSHATIILAGNTAPTNAALRDRFRVIDFPAIPQSQRRAIAATMIAEQPAPEGTSDEELTMMKQFAGQFVNLLLEVDKRHNCPGVRPMAKAISALMCLVRGQLLDGEPLDKKMVKACFSQEYRQEMSREAIAAQNAAASETMPPGFMQGFSFTRPRPNAPSQATASTSTVSASEIQPASEAGATGPQE